MTVSKDITDNIAEYVINPEKPDEPKPYARTGCLLLDLIIGGGRGLGIPYGRIINIIGDKSSGKSFLSSEIVAANFHAPNPFSWNYDDGESGFTFDSPSLYGFEIMHPETVTSKTVEKFDTNHRKFVRDLKKDQFGIYVLDTLDGISDDDKELRAERRQKAADAGKEFKEGTYGMATPKFLSQEFFKTQAGLIKEKNSLLIIVSQVREDINRMPMNFNKWIRSGGKALDFYAHTCLWLANVKKIKKMDRVIGVIIHAKTTKSKTPRPYRECRFVLYFDYGIDDIGSSLDFLFDLRGKDGELLGTANEITWDENKRGMGKKTTDAAKGFLQAKHLYKECRDARKTAESKTDLSLAWVENWVKSQNEDIQKGWEEYFGDVYTRKDMIKKIAENLEMRTELEKQVIAKWEDLETKASSGLGRKYQ